MIDDARLDVLTDGRFEFGFRLELMRKDLRLAVAEGLLWRDPQGCWQVAGDSQRAANPAIPRLPSAAVLSRRDGDRRLGRRPHARPGGPTGPGTPAAPDARLHEKRRSPTQTHHQRDDHQQRWGH